MKATWNWDKDTRPACRPHARATVRDLVLIPMSMSGPNNLKSLWQWLILSTTVIMYSLHEYHEMMV
jgi:hypothetical protein